MIGYVAKDKDGDIYLYKEKPIYKGDIIGWCATPDMLELTGPFPEFDNMSYTDEPVKVEIKLEKVCII